MKKELIVEVMQSMLTCLDNAQLKQLQRLLGHRHIETTLQYAMIKQNNVKIAHKKYIG